MREVLVVAQVRSVEFQHPPGQAFPARDDHQQFVRRDIVAGRGADRVLGPSIQHHERGLDVLDAFDRPVAERGVACEPLAQPGDVGGERRVVRRLRRDERTREPEEEDQRDQHHADEEEDQPPEDRLPRQRVEPLGEEGQLEGLVDKHEPDRGREEHHHEGEDVPERAHTPGRCKVGARRSGSPG